MSIQIEFAGLPASGKTTLALALKKHLLTMSLPALSRQKAIIQCLRRRDGGFIQNTIKRFPPRIWYHWMEDQFLLPEFISLSSQHLEFIQFLSKMLSESSLPEELIRSIWNTIVRSFAEIQIVSEYGLDSEIIIMDEAFSQRCFTLFGYMGKNISDELIYCYAELAPISDHIIWIATNPKTCIERLKKRYKNRPSPYELDSKELLGEFKSGDTVLSQLSQALTCQGKCVHRINGDNDLNQSLAEINKLFQGIWFNSPHGNPQNFDTH